MSIEWQYTIVGLIIGICMVLLLRGVVKMARKKGGHGGCAGCALSDTCSKPKNRMRTKH